MTRRELPFEPDYLTDEIDPSIEVGSPEWSAEIGRLVKLREPLLDAIHEYAAGMRRDDPNRRYGAAPLDRSESTSAPD